MSRNIGDYSRRNILKQIGVTGVSIVGVGVASARKNHSSDVPKGKAREIVENKVDAVSDRSKLADWQGATIGQPTTFYAKNRARGPEYVPTAYVFAVQKNGEDVGYVTASARSDWAPILEYSPATPPTRLVAQARSVAKEQSQVPTDRLLYHGGVKYGLELDNGQALNVRNGRPSTVGRGIDPASMSFDPTTVRRQRDTLSGNSGNTSSSEATASSEEVTTSSSFDTLIDVPAWTEHDGTGANITNYGPAKDYWAEWDGCVPVAASMIIAYHEGYTESDTYQREYIIDHLHDSMKTTDDTGETFPTNIDDGFNNYTEGSHSYNGRNIYAWVHPDFTKREITDNKRPFLLNMNDGGTADDRSEAYGDHTTTVVGYASDGDELELHDTWDDTWHYLNWGSWSECSYTKVTKS